MQFIPARGRKLDRVYFRCIESKLQFIPARGRKLCFPRPNTHKRSLQFIPARGRKHSSKFLHSNRLSLQFIPARGRKLDIFHVHFLLFFIAIYPREGTETIRVQTLEALSVGHCNLSPRGDGNMAANMARFAGLALQFIPARGRKLLLLVKPCPVHPIAIYPCEGTETLRRNQPDRRR